MVTRAKAGIFKPLECMNCHVTTTLPLPHSHVHALRNPKEVMLDEYNALITNGTWVLIPRHENINVVCSMWIFKHKFYANGLLSRYKAHLVANRRSQQQGIDCDETFSLVVKLVTIHTILSLVISLDWPIHQLDVKNAFLHGQLSETLYMHQPPGFVDSHHPDYRSLSGMFLSPSKFTEEILERAHMQNCNPCKTPVDTESKHGLDDDPVCLYMHDPRDPHFTTLKRILRYVRGTLDYGLQLHVSSTTQLTAYIDSAKRQFTLSRSSAEAEYRGVANVLSETTWIRNLLFELHTSLFIDTLVYCDNYADIFTKGIPVALFLEFRSSLNIQRPPVSTSEEY
nr:ribonuclease H-like domain-containing protein [Tanacetum cinerariifolium]